MSLVDNRCKCLVTKNGSKCRWCRPQEIIDDLLADVQLAAKCNINLREKLKERDNRIQELLGELLWINEDVWPLVHGLTSRQTLRDRFRRLPDIINGAKS